MLDVYFWRQFLVITSLLLHSICDGVSYSFPGIVNAVILSPNTTDITATPEQASHIAAIPGFGAFIGIFFLSALLQNIGRKLTYICILSLDLISWAILPFAGSVNTILAARLIRGVGDGLLYNGIMISEYADPKRRGYLNTFRKLFLGVGALVSHNMAMHYTFREISILPVIALSTAIIITFFWPESPAYSAYRGRFDECERNFLWLHGNSKEKIKELQNLMGAQMTRLQKIQMRKQNIIKTFLKTFFKKDFAKASFLTTILLLFLELSGRHYYLAFINQVFMMIVSDESIAAYFSIISDTLTILSLTVSSFVIYYFKRRTLIFAFGLLTATLTFTISIAEFLKLNYSIGLTWFEPALMLLLNIAVNMGVVPVVVIIIVEIYPLEHRGLGLCVAIFILIMFNYLFALKLTPMIMNSLGLHGTFGIFGVGIIICIVFLYYLLPETKDKTMQDIEDEVKNIDKSIIELRPLQLKDKLQHHNDNTQ